MGASGRSQEEEMKEKILYLMDPDQRRVIGTNARKNVLEHSWEKVCDHMLNIYKEATLYQ